MDTVKWYVLIIGLLLLCIMPLAGAASTPGYATTYTINLQPDGAALWSVEYRTPLVTNDDLANFQNYSADISSVYLPQFEALMQNSAAQAASGTSRPMSVDNFSGNAVTQMSPTGEFGVVTYTFTWTNFSVPDGGLTAGDAFAGGLYLDEDSTLIVRYPNGYTVTSADPAPDQQSGTSLVWYGQRTFDPGEPQVVLAGPSLPVLPLVIVIVVAIITTAGFMVYRKRRQLPVPEGEPGEPEEPSPALSEADLATLEEKVTRLLKAHGGERFQSEIVKELGLPKSTVSSTLNDLHQRGIIQKIKKGRENLIRLVGESVPSAGKPGDLS
ncbi:MAG: MarR family transcriptional regulator [Methanoregula sp.]|uniref:helix-turn-helix transcriptional regulator n=1 Tax=Methanoregula sp. TaxID=2052170 RepID=UPI003BB22006